MTRTKAKANARTEADLITGILANYRSRIDAIEARVVPPVSYVLAWGDGRFVRIHEGKANVTGFENATFFDDRIAAQLWLARGLTDGAHIAPAPLLALDAKRGAIIILHNCIDMVEEQAMPLRIVS
jgi:hypothetical protein